jgi:hypothetical protein
MLEVVEEAATADDHYRDALAGVRRDHVRRVTRDIQRLQSEGVADTDIDAAVAAGALCAMVEGFGRHWYGRGEQSGAAYDDDTAVETLSLLWARGLGLRTPTGTSTEEQG